jgi:DHA2 family multidrug resistance protein
MQHICDLILLDRIIMGNTQEQEWKFQINPWITMAPVMLSIFMFALDETISNVALPYMAGTFSISHNESTWIITSYLVASGVIIPTVDFFSRLIGRKQYFARDNPSR